MNPQEQAMQIPEQQMPQEPIIPQDEGQAASGLEPTNPYDTSAQESELSALQEELNQSISALDSNFAEFYAENMSDDVEELFFEDRVAFLIEVEKAKQAFIEEKITPLQQKGQELEQNISNRKQGARIWQAQKDFLKAYPDADLDEMLRFYNEELTPKQKQALNSEEDLVKSYIKVYEYMNGGSEDEQSPKEKKRNFPKQTSGQFGNVKGLDLDLRDSDLPINRR